MYANRQKILSLKYNSRTSFIPQFFTPLCFLCFFTLTFDYYYLISYWQLLLLPHSILTVITITSFHTDSYYYYLIPYWQLLLLPHFILTVIIITSFHIDSYHYYLISYWQLLLLPHFILSYYYYLISYWQLLLLPHFILTVITITSFHTDSYLFIVLLITTDLPLFMQTFFYLLV
jgi:hypothetical protein